MSDTFKRLSKIDVSAYTEKKNGLTYLSWAQAWREFKSHCPDATYEIVKSHLGKPYLTDSELGYMVMTEVTTQEETHQMWLPVLDFRNKAIPVGQATMFDINTAIMRCLTKNLAMFGLGIYIYAGEDLPIQEAMSTEDALEAITATDSIEALQKTWIDLPAALKKRNDIIEAKNFQKEALTAG